MSKVKVIGGTSFGGLDAKRIWIAGSEWICAAQIGAGCW